jgi:hypothetical protein
MNTGAKQSGQRDRLSLSPAACSWPAAALVAARPDRAVAHRTRPLPSNVCPPQWPGRILRALALTFFLLAPAPGPAHPQVIKIPFRSVDSMILVEGKVNDDPVTFLLDTGSLGTIVSARMYRLIYFPLHTIQRNARGPGVNGESVSVRLDLQLGNHRWIGQRVSIMNLDELSKIIGIQRLDGLLGEDILRQFRSVRIDYHAHVIELEE